MSTDLAHMIMSQEGTGPYRDGHFYPYVDSVGKSTIGYGHNLESKGIPESIATQLLMADVADAIEDVRHCCSVYDQLSRPRQMVMCSLAFNLGRAGLSKFVRFLGAIHSSQWDEAADELLNSKAAQQASGRYTQLAKMMRENRSEWV